MSTTRVSIAAGCKNSLLGFGDMKYIVDTFEDCHDQVQALLPGEASSRGRRGATEAQADRNLYMTASPSRTATGPLRTKPYGTAL
jgi:hypothetical protein